MDYLLAVLFGAVQGLTEFIPVSSSGHLVILHRLFPDFIQEGNALAFDVALHVGTLIALMSFFWKDCVLYLRAFFSSVQYGVRTQARIELTTDQRLAWLILLAIIPAGAAGLFLEDIITQLFRSTSIVIVMLAVVALLFLVMEYSVANQLKRSMDDITWRHALFIGVLQVLALVPGTSRSGITILAGMMVKLTREQAARFSFLISIPLIFGAGLKKAVDFITIVSTVGIESGVYTLLCIGTATSAIVGYFAIRFLLQFLSSKTLKPFAYYRLALAAIIALLLSFQISL